MRAWNGRIASGIANAANLSSATKIVGAVTGKTLSIKTLTVSMSAAGNILIQDNAATPVVIFPTLYFGANGGTTTFEFEPGSYKTSASGLEFDALASVTGAASVAMECYVLSS